jgi:spore coat polysaccharide biosynthesis protein SpsF (cytidylyltransferase family)
MNSSLGVIQVRIGSHRLPQKALKLLGERSLIGNMFYRAKKIRHLDKLICAIPLSSENDCLELEAKKYGIEVYRGQEDNVLSRFIDIIDKYKPKYVLRLTGDKPIFDPQIHEKAMEIIHTDKFDYISNNMPASWPHGFDVEVFTAKALIRSSQICNSKFNIEHVTPFLRSSPSFIRANIFIMNRKYKNLRFTVDFKEDFYFLEEFLKKSKCQNDIHNWKNIRMILDRFPNLQNINKDYFNLDRSVSSDGSTKQILIKI